MSLYAEFLKEFRSDQIIESDEGFVTYRFLGSNQVYIVDIYVKPELRNAKVGTYLADQVVSLAQQKGCTELIGSVVPTANKSTESLKVLLAYGMKLKSSGNDLIIFGKDI